MGLTRLYGPPRASNAPPPRQAVPVIAVPLSPSRSGATRLLPHVTGSKAPLIDFCTFTLTHDDIEVIVFGKRRKTPDVPGVQEFGYRSL